MSPVLTQSDAPLRPAPGRDTPLPEWAWTTDRNALPSLEWNGEADRPDIGCRVDVVNPDMGTGTVEYYTHAKGVLRIVVLLDSVPAWLELPEGVRHVNLFGDQIIRLDQGDGDVPELPSVLPLPVATAAPAPAMAVTPELSVPVAEELEEQEEEPTETEDGAPDEEPEDEDERSPDEEDEDLFSAAK